MHKIAIISTALFLIFLSGAGYMFNAKLPALANKQLLSALANIGFENVTFADFETRIGAARFKNIALDSDNVSTIKRLEIHYSPLSLILNAQPSAIIIDGLNLLGELSEEGDITISGWDAEKYQLNARNGTLKALTIQNSNISLLTENRGGIALDYDIQMHLRNKQIEFQAHATSRQKTLSFVASIKGFINEENAWQADIEIEQGKFEFDEIRISRLNGWINILNTKNQPLKIASELRAGGANLYDLPWQNVSATLEGSPDRYQIFADMKSVGFEGLELSLNLKQQNNKTQTSGQLYTEKLETLTHYLAPHNLKPFNKEQLEKLEGLQDINIDFTYQRPEVKFRIKNDGEDIDLNGQFNLDDQG